MFGTKSKSPVRVLLVEDSPTDAEIIQRALDKYRRAEFHVVRTTTIKESKENLKREPFDLVLLDHNLPGEDGLDLLRTFSGNTNVPPVIMLTGQADVLVARDSILFGARNYLSKDSITPDVLGDAIRDALTAGQTATQLATTDQGIEKIAFIDPVTGLYNRRYLDHILERECTRTRRYNHWISCLLIKIETYEDHADTFGVAEGDSLLRQVAAVFTSSIRDADVPARTRSDEFHIMLPETEGPLAVKLAERLRNEIAAMQVIVNKRSVSVTANIGVFTPTTETQLRPSSILDNVRKALDKARSAGLNEVSEI